MYASALDLKMALAERAPEFVAWLLPLGRRQGREWLIGSVDGEAGQSCRIVIAGIKCGMFYDFATGDGGSNLVELLRHVHRVDFRGDSSF